MEVVEDDDDDGVFSHGERPVASTWEHKQAGDCGKKSFYQGMYCFLLHFHQVLLTRRADSGVRLPPSSTHSGLLCNRTEIQHDAWVPVDGALGLEQDETVLPNRNLYENSHTYPRPMRPLLREGVDRRPK